MSRVRIVEDVDECRTLWDQVMPKQVITDLWEVRSCFQRHFQNPLRFIVKEEHGMVLGLLPLSWIKESHCHGFFPGETWQGATWLEQNRIFAIGSWGRADMLAHCPGPYNLRYVNWGNSPQSSRLEVDEVGYLFHPPAYDYRMDNYFSSFSGKSLKQIRRELAQLESHGAKYRYGRLADLELMLTLNRARFGCESYFSDPRFAQSFLDLAGLLAEKGWLRVVTLLLGGQAAAVDMGCVYKGTYTLLAGGTNPDWPGAAKMMNLHQMEMACRMRVREVDFLCGDFTWKKNFHLVPRPLYKISSPSAALGNDAPAEYQAA